MRREDRSPFELARHVTEDEHLNFVKAIKKLCMESCNYKVDTKNKTMTAYQDIEEKLLNVIATQIKEISLLQSLKNQEKVLEATHALKVMAEAIAALR